MCYNPSVSLFTAFAEFFLSGFMLAKYRFASTRYFFAALLIMLGAYQFSEFMLCKSSLPEMWAMIGFVIYTCLPAIGLHGTMACLGKKSKLVFVYLLPVMFVLLAMSYSDFILLSQCQTIFVTVHNALFRVTTPYQVTLFTLYNLYYGGFMFWSCMLCLFASKKEPDLVRKKILLMFPVGVILMTLPTFVLLVLFPALNYRFPSVLCHFALLLALAGFVAVRMEEENLKRGKL